MKAIVGALVLLVLASLLTVAASAKDGFPRKMDRLVYDYDIAPAGVGANVIYDEGNPIFLDGVHRDTGVEENRYKGIKFKTSEVVFNQRATEMVWMEAINKPIETFTLQEDAEDWARKKGVKSFDESEAIEISGETGFIGRAGDLYMIFLPIGAVGKMGISHIGTWNETKAILSFINITR